jgi:hypothetical protein
MDFATGFSELYLLIERNVLQADDNDFPRLEGCHRFVTRKEGDSESIRIGSKGFRSFSAQRVAWHPICK